jgi:SNF2 family DNA or RNA helicase
MNDFVFKTKPFDHQLKVFMESRDKEYYALLMEQGTGKTKVAIDTSAWLYANGKIDAVLIIAPSGVQRNWVINEIPAHLPDYCNGSSAWYSSSPTKQEEKNLCATIDHEGLKLVAINIEALATVKGVAFIKKFLMSFRTMMIVDESSTVKNPKAIRTKNLLKLSIHSCYRRILTGTPVTQGPLDLYTQFSFLDNQILHTQSYFAFRNRYAVMQTMQTAGRSFQTVTGYQNVEELTKLIEPHSYRVTKSECLDLPEKLYSKRYVTLSDNQSHLYKTLKKDIVAEYNGMVMSAPLALTKLLRLQQIVGGFFVPDPDLPVNSEDAFDFNYTPSTKQPVPQAIDPINNRVESLINLLEEVNGKVIIWARFRAEIEIIVRRIGEEFGAAQCVEYHGGIDNERRSDAVLQFQSNNSCRFFVGHVQAGGKGLTLHAASTVVYYSNDFSLENRLQSEDRAHRIGQKNHVTYVDMIAEKTLDEKIVKTLRGKKSIADLITGDFNLAEWI